jgi:hypothetical protein
MRVSPDGKKKVIVSVPTRTSAAVDEFGGNVNQRIPTGVRSMFNKVPEVTLAFWIVKILSTTVGETAADYLAVNIGSSNGEGEQKSPARKKLA